MYFHTFTAHLNISTRLAFVYAALSFTLEEATLVVVVVAAAAAAATTTTTHTHRVLSCIERNEVELGISFIVSGNTVTSYVFLSPI